MTVMVVLMLLCNSEYFRLYGGQLTIYFSAVCLVLFVALRAAMGRALFAYLARSQIYTSRILIVGGDDAAKKVARSLKRARAEFEIVGFLDDYKEVGAKITDQFGNLGKLPELPEISARLNVDEIIIAIDNAPYKRLIEIVEVCLSTGKYVQIYSNFLNVIADKIKVEFYGEIPVIALRQFALNDSAWTAKRILDIIISSVSLVVLSPLFLIIAAGIKLSSTGPVIYRHIRIGKNGRPFSFYKFRSMHVNSDASRHKEFVTGLIKNGNGLKQEQEIRIFKMTDDPRIFPFGKFLRKTSLDEFPQFFNVLKGSMTLVGPRPCLPYEWECYSDWHKERLTAPPGCTGLWQAVGRSAVTFEEMVILDLYYISNMTLLLDLKIVLQTIPVIFFAKGAH